MDHFHIQRKRNKNSRNIQELVKRTRISNAENYIKHGRLEVFTAVTMKNGVFFDVTLCGSGKNRRFGGN
jgi:hypothetical protein